MDDQTASKPEAPKSQSGALQDVALRDFGQTFAFGVALVYVCGFIVVTAYLGKFGLHDYAAFRMQYLVAGTMILLLVGLFVYFVARNITPDNTDVERLTTLITPISGDKKKWSFLAAIFLLVSQAYSVILCTIISAVFLFPLPNHQTFWLLIAIAFGSSFINSAIPTYARNPPSLRSFVLLGAYMALVVIAYVQYVDGLYLYLAYFYFAALAVLYAYQGQQRSTTNPKALAFYFSIAGMVGFSAVFGANFYGDVRSAVGGATPVPVRILIDEQRTTRDLARVFQRHDGTLAPVVLLAETDTELLIRTVGSSDRYEELLRVKRDLIKAILMDGALLPH